MADRNRCEGSMGGEPNFDGQANSRWLHQNDIGAVIYRPIQVLLGEAAWRAFRSVTA